MKDEYKTKRQLINELIELRKLIAESQTLITERKRAEETLRIKDSAIDSSINGIVISNLEGYLTYANQSFLKMWGYDEKEVLGKHILKFCQKEKEVAEVIEALQDEGWVGETKARRKDGSLFDVSFSASMVKDKDGNPMCMMGSFIDVTERKKMEEKIKEYTETLEEKIQERTIELEETNLELQVLNKELNLRRQEAEDAKLHAMAATRAKSDFLANMSHELRTPLNAIIGFSDMMFQGMTGKLTEQQHDYLGDIRESGELLLSLINDILDLSKVEAGKMELELSEFYIKDLIESCMILFKEKAVKHGIKFMTEVAPDVGLNEADVRKIKQVIANLLSNAVKFTPDGGSVRVKARLVNSEQYLVNSKKLFTDDYSLTTNRYFIEISVEDTGIGIRLEDIDKLFQPFQQLEYTLTKKYEGTGLGLTLCKRIVELHKGRIWVESEVGKGSKFTFLIPAKQKT